jgi:hypothetical protein
LKTWPRPVHARQLAAHVAVLAALAGEEEGDLARFGRPLPRKMPCALQRLPGLRIVEAGRLARLASFSSSSSWSPKSITNRSLAQLGCLGASHAG